MAPAVLGYPSFVFNTCAIEYAGFLIPHVSGGFAIRLAHLGEDIVVVVLINRVAVFRVRGLLASTLCNLSKSKGSLFSHLVSSRLNEFVVYF